MPESTVEEQLAYRQLNMKSIAWYIQIRDILMKYNLPCFGFAQFVLFKVFLKVDTYWASKIIGEAHVVPQHPIVYARKVTPLTKRDRRVHERSL